ncbi:MAG: EF-hand domain-containing protein [Pseudomonadota bacterium]
MNKRILIPMAIAGVAVTALVFPFAADAHKHGDRGGHGPRAGWVFLETFDLDGNGEITQEEINTYRSNQITEFDTDGDGQLTLEEYEALWLDAMRERMVDRFQGHDDDGDGIVTLEEFSEPYSSMVERRDRNDDGVLSADDMRRHGRGDRDDGGRGSRNDD